MNNSCVNTLDAALRDMRTIIRLANSLENEPMILSLLVRMAAVKIAI